MTSQDSVSNEDDLARDWRDEWAAGLGMFHVSATELLGVRDGHDLSPRAAAHLRSCGTCRERLALEIEAVAVEQRDDVDANVVLTRFLEHSDGVIRAAAVRATWSLAEDEPSVRSRLASLTDDRDPTVLNDLTMVLARQLPSYGEVTSDPTPPAQTVVVAMRRPEPSTSVPPALQAERAPWRTYAAAAAVLLSTGTSVYVARQLNTERHNVVSLQSALEGRLISQEARFGQLREQLEEQRAKALGLQATIDDFARSAAKPSSPSVAASQEFVLSEDEGVRGSGTMTTLALRSRTARAKLILEIPQPNSFRTLRAEINSFAGDQVWGLVNLRPEGNHVVLDVPATVFESDDYRVSLVGRDSAGLVVDVATFVFRITRVPQ